MTKEGYENLVAELHRLEAVEMPKASAAIAEARDKGDLSENSEYDAAKEEQRSMEARIEELEFIIKNAEIIDESAFESDVVSIGSTVRFYDIDHDEEECYRIVGSTEANLLEGKISNESQVGKSLLGHRADDVVEVETLDGIDHYRILEISRDEEPYL